jgi:hypothetical protein
MSASEVLNLKRSDVRVVVRLREAATATSHRSSRSTRARAETVDRARLEIDSARACGDARQTLPTHFQINDLRNSDVRRRLPEIALFAQGFGVCDTVLTQSGLRIAPTSIETY